MHATTTKFWSPLPPMGEMGLQTLFHPFWQWISKFRCCGMPSSPKREGWKEGKRKREWEPFSPKREEGEERGRERERERARERERDALSLSLSILGPYEGPIGPLGPNRSVLGTLAIFLCVCAFFGLNNVECCQQMNFSKIYFENDHLHELSQR